MRRSCRLRAVVCCSLAVAAVAILDAALAGSALASTTETFQVTVVSNTTAPALNPMMSGDRLVWDAVPDGSDTELVTWTPGGGTYRITTNTYSDSDKAISGDRIVWDASPDGTSDIFTWTPSTGTRRITTNTFSDVIPQVSGDRVVWQARPADGSDSEIYMWTPGGNVQRLTNNTYDDTYPQVSGDRVVWTAYNGGSYQVWSWTPLEGVTRIVADTVNDMNPAVSGNRITWTAVPTGGATVEIYTWTPAGGAQRVTYNSFTDYSPVVSGDRIAWAALPSDGFDYEVYSWTPGTGVQRLTNDTFDQTAVQVSGSRLAWLGKPVYGAGAEIYTWTPSWGTVRVTNDTVDQVQMRVSGDRFVWDVFGTNDQMITAVARPAVKSLSPSYGSTSAGATVKINGTGFTGATKVMFGTTAATSITVNSRNLITAVAPAHAYGAVNVTVTTPLGTSSTAGTGDNYTFYKWYEQNSTRLFYKGTWSTQSDSLASGGSYVATTSTSASLRIPFFGSNLTLLAMKGPHAGIMSFSVDNGPVGAVDLYSATTAWRSKVFASTFGPGFHVLELSCVGAKNALSDGTEINLDSVLVLGDVATLTRYEQTDSRFSFSGSWTKVTQTGPSGGSEMRTTSSTAYVVIPFRGLKADLIATIGPGMGKANVSVDGGTATVVDLSAGSTDYQKRKFTSGLLGLGPHTLKISWNTGNTAGKAISVDAVEIIGELVSPTTYEESSTQLLWGGAWTYPTNINASSGAFAKATTAGAKVNFYLYGSRLDIIAGKAPTYGKLKITIDSVVRFADLYNATLAWKQPVWSSGFIRPGYHYVTIEFAGSQNSASGGTDITLDAIKAWGTIMKYVVG